MMSHTNEIRMLLKEFENRLIELPTIDAENQQLICCFLREIIRLLNSKNQQS